MRSTRTIILVTIVSALVVPLALGQVTQTKKKSPAQEPAPAVADKARSRTVKPAGAAPATQDDAAERPQTPAASPSASTPPVAEQTPVEKPAEKITDTTSQPTVTEPVVKDPILSLREQIDSAATPQDRIRLKLQLAEMLVANGRRAEAVNELHSVTAVDAFDPQGFYNAGNALARLGDTVEAINAYHKAIEQRNGRYSRALNNLGVVLLRAGRWDESQDALLSALRVEGFRYAEASYNLGRLYASRGQTDLAVREWRRALAVDPKHKAAADFLARVRDEDRISVESSVSETTTRGSNRTSPPRVASAAEKPATLKTVPGVTKTKPLSLDPVSFGFLQKARSASERGNSAEAIVNYQRLISRQSGYFAPANLELSYLLIGLKRNDEALANLQQVASREGARYPISHYHLARLYELRGELKLAEASYSQTVAAYSQNGQFLLDLSRVREKLGDFQGALQAMERFVTLVKSDGQHVAWPEERVAMLRQKLAAAPK